MLKGLLVGYLLAHWQCCVVMVAAMAGVAFALDLYQLNGAGTAVQRMSGTEIAVYWGTLVGGVLLALLERVVLSRVREPMFWWPFREETLRELLVALVMLLALFWYDTHVDDPAGSVIEPFASGAALSVAFVWLVALCVELIELWTGVQPPRRFHWLGVNLFGAAVLSVLAALDVAVFRGGWLLVLIVVGALAGCWWLGQTLTVLLWRR